MYSGLVTQQKTLRIARILWTLTFLLFIAGVAAGVWGSKLQLAHMSAGERSRADITVINSQWAGRSILLFLLSAGCGVAGVVYNIKASDRQP